MKIDVKLLCINNAGALYEVMIDDSLARAQFTVKPDVYPVDNIVSSEHFRQGVHKAVADLKRLNPEYYSEQLKELFVE